MEAFLGTVGQSLIHPLKLITRILSSCHFIRVINIGVQYNEPPDLVTWAHFNCFCIVSALVKSVIGFMNVYVITKGTITPKIVIKFISIICIGNGKLVRR